MRMIDADALIMALRLEYPMIPMFKENQEEWGIKTEGYRKAEEVIKEAPTIEPKRGEWIETEYTGRIYGIYRCQYKCSCCEYVPMYRGEPIAPTTGTLLFCPNCGARMKGADDE